MVNLRLIKQMKPKNEELGERLRELAADRELIINEDNITLDRQHMIEANFDNIGITIYDFSYDTPYCSTRKLWEIDYNESSKNGKLISGRVIAERFGYCIFV